MFSAPIPGQSLTSEPKNSPWENPPQISSPEDALMWHIDRLTKKDKTKAAVTMLQLGIDVVTLTEGILRAAVSEGRHTIDVSLIIAPIVHEFIKNIAEEAGIDYEEGIEEEEMSQEDIDYAIESRKASKILEDMEDTGEVDLSTLEEPTQETSKLPEEIVEDKPIGLMSRRNV